MAGYRDGNLPAEELCGGLIWIEHGETKNGLIGCAERVDALIQLAGLAEINKEAVAAIDIGRTQGLQRHRQNTFAILAAGLSHNLLDPVSEGGVGLVGEDGELVAASEGRFAEDRAEDQARIARQEACRGHTGAASRPRGR